jgi:hypothetical protein
MLKNELTDKLLEKIEKIVELNPENAALLKKGLSPAKGFSLCR